jgi:hypothetical protein
MAVSVTLVSTQISQAQTWVRTVEGCTFFEQVREWEDTFGARKKVDQSQLSVSSTIPCVNGKLQGEGFIQYFYRGNQYWEWQLSEARGAKAVAGVITVRLDEKRFSLHRDRPSCKYIAILSLVAPADLAYEMPQVWTEVRAVARQIWSRTCKRPPLPADARFDLNLFPDDSPNPNPWLGLSSNYRTVSDRIPERYAQYWRQREEEAINRQQAALKEAEARRATKEREARRQQLAKQTGAFEIVSLDAIKPNPFMWQGKLVGTCVRFLRMLNPSTAEFRGGDFVSLAATGVPTARFRKEGVVFLVGRVTGRTTPGASVSFQYAAAVDQAEMSRCGDFIDPS